MNSCFAVCPRPCRCTFGFQIECENRNLTAVPKDLPSEMVVLDLSNNKITSLKYSDFFDCHNLEKLDISWNNLKTIEQHTFKPLANLKNLKMFNSVDLNNFDRNFNNTFIDLPNLESIDIRSNFLVKNPVFSFSMFSNVLGQLPLTLKL